MKPFLLKFARAFDRICGKLPAVGIFRPLRGSFSGIERLEKKLLQGELLHRSQQPGPCPPGSMTERSGMHQNDHQPWPVFWVRADRARLVGNAFQWRDGSDLQCSEGVFHHLQRHSLRGDRLFAQILVRKPAALPGAWTSLSSNWSNGKNYYHWMLDSLTRWDLQDVLVETWNRTKVTAIMVTHDVGEAILLADRVVMMTNGPNATIGKVLKVDLPRPRDRKELLNDPKFYAYRQEVLHFLAEYDHGPLGKAA